MAQRQQPPLVSNLVILGIALLLAASHFTSDLHSPLLFLLKAALPIVTIALLVLITMFALFKRQKSVFITVFFAAIINVPFLLPKHTSSSQPAITASPKDTSMIAATFSTLTRTQNISDIVALTNTHQPALLCLQEVAQNDRKKLRQQLNKDYPFWQENGNNQVIVSLYPLRIDNDIGHFQSAILEHPSWGEVTVINTHMPRPYLNKQRHPSWGKLFKEIESAKKMILCGDLNITPNNSLYDVLRYQHGLNDSLTSGYGLTFPNAQRRSALLGPLIRIDYILTRGIVATNTKTVNASNLSDHRAVISKLVIDKSQ